jgi:hypothetical protein
VLGQCFAGQCLGLSLAAFILYRTGLLGIFVSERFLLIKVSDLRESKGAERWEQSQN